MAKQMFLSTSDNKWNPFTHFDEWYSYDTTEMGYNTLGYLARIAPVGSALSDADYDATVERAIDEAVKYNFIGIITGYKVNYVKLVA